MNLYLISAFFVAIIILVAVYQPTITEYYKNTSPRLVFPISEIAFLLQDYGLIFDTKFSRELAKSIDDTTKDTDIVNWIDVYIKPN